MMFEYSWTGNYGDANNNITSEPWYNTLNLTTIIK